MEKNIYKNMYSDQRNSSELADSQRIKAMKAIFDRLNPQSNTILDIGCFDGIFLSLVKNQDNDFYGLDASDWAIEHMQKKEIKIQKFFFDGKTKLPFEKDFFDIVIAGEIIEHIFDTDFFLEEISRVLKPGGRLLISTPNIASLGRRLLLLFGANPITEVSPNEANSVGHIRYFTRETLKNILAKHGFKIISSHSDCINFSTKIRLKSAILAKVFPGLGASIIYLAKK